MKHIFENIYMFIGVAIVMFMSCSHADGSHMSVREAQEVVVQADSLWHNGQMYGVDEGDSATLARAYETLKDHPVFSTLVLGTSSRGTYSHACYHYGKLLRAKDDPVAAMQAFIDATHSHTRDYHILGRVYSNIGDICHLAEEYQLSYDMFEKSAEMFLHNGDTLNYYYGLNNMAYELAEQGKEDETLFLVRTIINQCADQNVSSKIIETKARLFLKCERYDSTLHYSRILYANDTNDMAAALLIAQAYSYLSIKDSATKYANIVLSRTNELYEANNALYILTNDDETKDKDGIRETAADRSDTQKLIEIRQGKLSQAVQLLEQDLNRKPDWRWLYAILITLILIGIGSSIYIRTKHKRHQLLSQRIEDLENKNKEKQLQLQTQIEDRIRLIATSPNIAKTLNWNNFEQMCLLVDQNFNMLASKLRNKHVLNETEIRLCILVFIGLNRAQISLTLPYARSSIGKLKDHTAKQLGTTGKNLQHFLFNMATEK